MKRRSFFAALAAVIAAFQLPSAPQLRLITLTHHDEPAADRRTYDVFEVQGSDAPDVVAWKTNLLRAEPLALPAPFHRASTGQRYLGSVYATSDEAASVRLSPRSFVGVRDTPHVWHYRSARSRS